jgi:DNA-directed RNA polymerase subunit omega
LLNKPSLDELLSVMDSRYSLVVTAAKRARQLLEGAETKIEPPTNKYVTTALKEIDSELICAQPTKIGLK